MDPISLVAAAVPSIVSGIGSLFGGRKRRRREKAAQNQYNQALAGYKNFEFENAFEGLENPMEDLRVSTEAAEFQSQQVQQGLAQSLDALRGAGGGTGAAAVAQAMAGQQARTQQQIAADISKQEVMNERMAAQATMRMQAMEAQGAMAVQQQEFGRESTILGMQQQELAGARKARAEATSALGGMFGGIATAGIGAGLSGAGPLSFLQKTLTPGGK